LPLKKHCPRWDEEKGYYAGEGAAALNEQRRKIMHGELYADKPVFEEWRQEGRRREIPVPPTEGKSRQIFFRVSRANMKVYEIGST